MKMQGKNHFVDATFVKVRKSGSNLAGGRQHQPLGRTGGRLNTKIHTAVDAKDDRAALLSSAGNESDVSCAPTTLPGISCAVLVGGKSFNSDGFRPGLEKRAIRACIPPRSSRRNPRRYAWAACRKGRVVENFFVKLKCLHRVATRYDKLQQTFFGFVCLERVLNFFRY